VAGLLDRGAEPTTARSRQLALRRYSAWLVEDGTQPGDPLLGLRAPKLDAKVIEPLSDAELKAQVDLPVRQQLGQVDGH